MDPMDYLVREWPQVDAPHKGPVVCNFDVFVVVNLNKPDTTGNYMFDPPTLFIHVRRGKKAFILFDGMTTSAVTVLWFHRITM